MLNEKQQYVLDKVKERVENKKRPVKEKATFTDKTGGANVTNIPQRSLSQKDQHAVEQVAKKVDEYLENYRETFNTIIGILTHMSGNKKIAEFAPKILEHIGSFN